MKEGVLFSGVYIGMSEITSKYLRDHDGLGNKYYADNHETMAQTVLSAVPFCGLEDNVLFGMPDTYIEDEQCYAKLAVALADCDVAVGVFETRRNQRNKLGMVSFTPSNKVLAVEDKPENTNLVYAWGTLAWRPSFWQYLTPDMPHVGYGLMPAIEAGLNVRAVVMDGGYWDCGTASEYFELIKAIT